MSIIETQQTGGNHYKGMGIQPVTFAYANNWDACAFSTLKYVSRHRRKGGAEDLNKALDFVDFRVELVGQRGARVARNLISMDQYLSSNRITEDDALILRALNVWVTGKSQDPDETVRLIKGLINDLRISLYSKG